MYINYKLQYFGWKLLSMLSPRQCFRVNKSPDFTLQARLRNEQVYPTFTRISCKHKMSSDMVNPGRLVETFIRSLEVHPSMLLLSSEHQYLLINFINIEIYIQIDFYLFIIISRYTVYNFIIEHF